MFEFESSKKYLFVIDGDYYPLLFKYKNENPKINIKIITKQSLLDKIGYRYVKDPVPYLIVNKKLNYDKAKKTANLLRVLNGSPNNPLESLKLELKGYLTYDEYGEIELKRFEVF